MGKNDKKAAGGKGKGADKDTGGGGGKAKGAQSINVRHILVRSEDVNDVVRSRAPDVLTLADSARNIPKRRTPWPN